MPEFFTVIEQLSTFDKAIFIFICLSGALLAEYGLPLKHQHKSTREKAQHLAINLSFLILSAIINSLFAYLFLTAESSFHFGLFTLVEIPWLASLLIAFLAFDFIAQYLCHIALHKTPWLWKLHMIHHNDFHVDVSTGSRHHPLDYCCRELAALLCFILLSAPISFYISYKLLSIFFTYFTHANIKLPKKIEHLLAFIFITPNIHKVHHHQRLPFTDSNYGNIFSFWDRLFRTLSKLDTQKINYGLDTDQANKELSFLYQIARPFLAKNQKS